MAVFVEAIEVIDAAVGAGFASLPAVLIGLTAGHIGVVVEIDEGDPDFALCPDVVDATRHEVGAHDFGHGGD